MGIPGASEESSTTSGTWLWHFEVESVP